MKFLALLTTILPMAMAATGLDTRDDSVTFDADLALHFVEDLIKTGEISITGPADEHDKRSLSLYDKRADVPFLHCGYARALRCVGTTAGTLNSCLWAVISRGKDKQWDATCAASAVALRAGLSTDCKLCLGMSTS